MKHKKFNLDLIDTKIFESDQKLDDFIKQPEDDLEDILIRCKKYDDLNYTIRLNKITDGKNSYWMAEHPELPGCVTHGETKEESLANLEDAKQGWIFAKVSEGESVPIPKYEFQEQQNLSGKILLRLPKELHYKVVQMAKANSISINKELNYLISYAMGEVRAKEDISSQLREIKDLLVENQITKKVDTLEKDLYSHYYLNNNLEEKYRGKNIDSIGYANEDSNVFGQTKKVMRSLVGIN
ncbi:toxin-antitoxin system HicB family antitoxin [Desulfosporosinus sp. BG]|uniref:toxin-antitoxin system HicB family antitoxin n=1 Tax=Desulfosporosinus sp. BG TaxID=1633135 RepID=UPI00083A7F56|nr:toxin-antitoxin system HicB family antitoxin [Desulfosporosinus sp. BG]ODA39984.1 hypothetical protein DSBG_3275 [Desulfosporosinus sp. BG]